MQAASISPAPGRTRPQERVFFNRYIEFQNLSSISQRTSLQGLQRSTVCKGLLKSEGNRYREEKNSVKKNDVRKVLDYEQFLFSTESVARLKTNERKKKVDASVSLGIIVTLEK